LCDRGTAAARAGTASADRRFVGRVSLCRENTRPSLMRAVVRVARRGDQIRTQVAATSCRSSSTFHVVTCPSSARGRPWPRRSSATETTCAAGSWSSPASPDCGRSAGARTSPETTPCGSTSVRGELVARLRPHDHLQDRRRCPPRIWRLLTPPALHQYSSRRQFTGYPPSEVGVGPRASITCCTIGWIRSARTL